MDNFPRRSQIEKNTPAELAIRKAMDEVEDIGADTKLTNAVIKLNEVLTLVADFIDDK